MNVKRIIKKLFAAGVGSLVVLILLVFFINGYVITLSMFKIKNEETIKKNDYDCILILGCAVRPDGSLSKMLKDRMDKGIALYKAGVAPKLLVSGDHGTPQYDEVNKMKSYAIDHGVPSEDIFMDHAGFSTYESMYRAGNIFGVKKAVIVTQRYHLYRAIYSARQLGIEAYGVPAKEIRYHGQLQRDVREILARVKEVGTCAFRVKPSVLGDRISIQGNGDVTNDK